MQYAINSRGQLVDFRAEGVTVRVSPDNRVILLTTRPDRQTGIAAWCAAHRQSQVVGGGPVLAFALGRLTASLRAISGPFAAGSLLKPGLVASAADQNSHLVIFGNKSLLTHTADTAHAV
ncbi:hypothetical protein [Cupriavidus basilensis]|uniref:Uncharacterized protein n=1 Tax=Cupriavidus basilensis TaxID=68895 RepID=A0A0C4YQ81_9BURK|nr:hypothetical protein [Cupriavidus basilensis]AJG22766.1 hypothetical protein RR42_s1177 [Cupriavidus basilensis]